MHRHVFRAVDRLLIEVNRRLKEQGRGKDAKKRFGYRKSHIHKCSASDTCAAVASRVYLVV